MRLKDRQFGLVDRIELDRLHLLQAYRRLQQSSGPKQAQRIAGLMILEREQ
jgi:hypothetical protein